MLYLLHFDPPVGRAQHYLGCCRPERIQKRLAQHVRGQGAALTREAARKGCAIYYVRAFPEMSFEQERQIKLFQRLRDLCPMCCEMLRPAHPEQHRIDIAQPTPTGWRPYWGWTNHTEQE